MDVLFNNLLSLLAEKWVLLSLVAALGYTAVEFIDEKVIDTMPSRDGGKVGTLVLVSGFFGILVSAGFTTYAAATGTIQDLLLDPKTMYQALGVGVLEVVWMIPYLHAINRGGALNAAPLFQLVPVFSLAIGYLFFQEVPISWQIAGALAITGGGFVLNLRKDFRLDAATILLMCGASSIISLGYFLFKEASVESNFVGVSFMSGIGMFLMSVLIWMFYPPYRRQFDGFMSSGDNTLLGWQALNEAINSAAVVASHIAVVSAPSVMLATSLNAAHPVFIMLFGFGLKMFGSRKHGDNLSGARVPVALFAFMLIATGTAVIAVE